MEFLRDLMISSHHRHRPRRFEPHLREEFGQVGRKSVLGFVGIADLVVTQLEVHRAPWPASIVELHLEGLHPRLRMRCSRERTLVGAPL